VSTILKALEKRRREHETKSDPEAILERNAAYRRMARGGSSPANAPPWVFVFAVVSFVLVLLCAIATALLWMRTKPGGNRTPEVSEAIPKAALPTPTATPAPAAVQPVEPARIPILQETVRLRTRPMLRSAPTPDSSGVYATGSPSPSLASPPSPIATPQAILVFPAPVVFGQASGSPGGPTSGGKTTTTATAAPTQRGKNPGDFLQLTGIILDPKKPTALINDHIVQVGDVVEGVKVLAIDNPSSVRVEYEGKEYRLEMK